MMSSRRLGQLGLLCVPRHFFPFTFPRSIYVFFFFCGGRALAGEEGGQGGGALAAMALCVACLSGEGRQKGTTRSNINITDGGRVH